MAGTAPLVFDSPHSGVDYPGDFNHACDPRVLRRAEDTHVEKLYEFAPALAIAWVEALFPRSYLDVNRNTTEIDVSLFDTQLALLANVASSTLFTGADAPQR